MRSGPSAEQRREERGVIAAMSPGSATGATRAVLGRRRQREACAREQPNRDQSIDMQLREMGGRVTYPEQLQEDTGPILLINQFNVAPEDAGGACAPMACVTAALQSPPCATNSVYPRRCISTTQGARESHRIPAGGGWLGGEPVARQRRDHEMEPIRLVATA
jgi:hypothetical protein